MIIVNTNSGSGIKLFEDCSWTTDVDIDEEPDVRQIERPTIPRLTRRGAYEPRDMLKYIDLCRVLAIPPRHMAQDLNVPRYHVNYAIGPGYPLFQRRAMKAMRGLNT